MKSDYGKESYAEEFDAHQEITGAFPDESSWLHEFRSICGDADAEIAALRAQLEKADALASIAEFAAQVINGLQGESETADTVSRLVKAYKEARHG